jgi:hypothetical protein
MKSVVRVALGEHDLRFVIGIQSGIIGKYVRSSSFSAMLSKFFCFDLDGPETKPLGVLDKPIL